MSDNRKVGRVFADSIRLFSAAMRGVLAKEIPTSPACFVVNQEGVETERPPAIRALRHEDGILPCLLRELDAGSAIRREGRVSVNGVQGIENRRARLETSAAPGTEGRDPGVEAARHRIAVGILRLVFTGQVDAPLRGREQPERPCRRDHRRRQCEPLD
jgi:hypothetical protein